MISTGFDFDRGRGSLMFNFGTKKYIFPFFLRNFFKLELEFYSYYILLGNLNFL